MLLMLNIMMPSWACTGLRIKAQDGAIIHGRTLDFDIDLHVTGFFIPRNYHFDGTLPDGTKGISYQSKYALVGAGTFGELAIGDGINEKGLAIGDFYFPGYADYAQLTPDNKNKALSPIEFSNWVLTQFATVDEVKEGIKSVVIVPTIPKGWPELPPLHYLVYDKSGKSIVIEPIHGQLKVYDNPLGVLTNSPAFDWQMTNLANYINLSPVDKPSKQLGGLSLHQFSSGTGLLGLPGDYTSPSRFVRAAFFSTAAMPVNNADEAVLEAFHILNAFDIPIGSVMEHEGAKQLPERTYITVVRDPQHLKLYFKSFKDQSIRMVNLNKFDFNAKEIKRFPIAGIQAITEVTPEK